MKNSRAGNVYLEAALVLLPLLALLLAIVDFAMPIFLWSTFNHSVREGVRYGITYRTTAGLSQTGSIKQVVQRSAAGFLNGQSGLDKIVVKYYSPVTFAQVVGATANEGGNIVEVSIVGYTWNWMVPLWRSATPLSVNAISSDRLEMLPRGTARPVP